jgi:hypothetical protein
MAGSRSTPPLFDLIRPASDRGEEVKPVAPAKPASPPPSQIAASPAAPPAPRPVVTSPKPVIRLETSPPPSPPRVSLGAEEQPRQRAPEVPVSGASPRTLTIGTVWVGLAVAGVIASLILVWAIAYSSGQNAEKERLARLFDVPNGSSDEQGLANSMPPVLPRDSNTNPGGSLSGSVPEGPPRNPAVATPPAPQADTRQVGSNYLLCASQLSKESADAAAAFLTANGVPAIATGRGGKYTVYTLLGIPAGSLDEKLAVRNQHKAEVARIGQLWRKEHPGASDFSDAYWEKYKP